MKLKTPKLKTPHLRSFSWKVFPILAIIALLANVGYLAFTPAPQTFAQGEEFAKTAKYLPADTEFYTTIDLSLSDVQERQLYRLMSSWLSEPEIGPQLQAGLAAFETETGIDIEEDILPWLGDEAAMGLRDFSAMAEGGEPEFIMFISTTDADASYSFLREKLLPLLLVEFMGMSLAEAQAIVAELPASLSEFPDTSPEDIPFEGGIGQYGGIPIIISPQQGIYWAFPEDYIIFCYSTKDMEENLGKQTLDLYLAGGGSLYNTENFQEALANLPSPWVAMFYLDMTNIKELIPEMMPIDGGGDEIPVELIVFWLPDFVAGSVSLAEIGMSCSIYYPVPPDVEMPEIGNDLLYSTNIVPGDALAFLSVQNLNGGWEYILTQAAADPTADWAVQLQAMIDQLSLLGIDLSEDVFGWMTGEFAFALLPDFLILIEVENPTVVAGKLGDIITALGGTTTAGDIEGQPATLINIPDIEPLQLGYMFLDVDTTHFLVIGLAGDSLPDAVHAWSGTEPSLGEAKGFQGILSMLPEEKVGMGYIDIQSMMDVILPLIPEGEVPAEFEEFAPFIEPLLAMGFSSSYIDASGVLITLAIYCPLPPIYESVFAGNGTLDTEDLEADFSLIDPDVGTGEANIVMDYTGVTDGGYVNVMMAKSPSSDDWNGFALAASDAGLNLEDVAYVVEVEHNLSAENMGEATITMKVSRAWADSYGIDNIHIFHIDDEGNCQMLDTTFVGYEDDYAVFQATSPGLSTLCLGATSLSQAAKGWWSSYWWVVPIIVVSAIIIGVNVWCRRRAI